MPTIDDDAREELRLTVHVVPGWRLSDAAWRSVQSSLAGVEQALGRDDRGALFRHLEEIDRAAPRRLARLSPDEYPTEVRHAGPPEAVLELVNSLVHAPDPGGAAR